MYRSAISISTESRRSLEKKLALYIASHDHTYCKALKRKVSLAKLPEAITNRRDSAGNRLQRFFIALDILKREKSSRRREHKGCREYEVIGIDSNGTKVYIHLREEISIRKDKILYFISCY